MRRSACNPCALIPIHFNPRIVRKRCDSFYLASLLFVDTFQSTHRTQTMRLQQQFERSHRPIISIHASYANDATQLVFLTQSFRVISIHASYANDATDLYVQKIVFRGHFNPRIVRKRCDLIPEECNILRRHFNPRIVRKRCDEPGLSGLIASLNFNPRIVRKRCDV